MKFKLANIFLILALALTSSAAASAQQGELKPAPLDITVASTLNGNLDKDFGAPVRPINPSSNESGFQPVSVILQLDPTLDPSALADSTGGQVVHRYQHIFHGASIVLPFDRLEALFKTPGVLAVYPDTLHQLETDESPSFISAPALWSRLGGQGSAGEGVVVGLLDTGIWPEHPSFSDPDPAGKPYAAPPGGPYDCEFGNAAWNSNDLPFSCNHKLIGAYAFLDTYKALQRLHPEEYDSARDDNGHGTHTASTAAGNAGVPANIMDQDFGAVSGIAPRAHLIMYKVCGGAGCYSSDSAAAVDQAIADGVDVINFSISGGVNPYTDPVSLAFLRAYRAGIFVTASAGNNGPGSDTVNHREPWVATVAASTQPRTFLGEVQLTADNLDTLHLTGVSIGGSANGPVVLASAYHNALCGSVSGFNPFPPGTFTGSPIVVCQRGGTSRVEKSANVLEGGGGGMILLNPSVNSLNADNHFLPTVHLSNTDAVLLYDFLNTHTGVQAALQGGIKHYGQGDVLASFSARGGAGQMLGISKPDLTAPGVNILAGHTPQAAFPETSGAGKPGEFFQALSGTSMSSPHVAGSAALLKALHPDWSPGQIKSALMTSARVTSVYKEDGTTPAGPFDFGSGRLDLTSAAFPGLTISESAEGFSTHQNDLWNANYPSLFLPNMPDVITVPRLLHSESRSVVSWRTAVESPSDLKIQVDPIFSIRPGKDRTLNITIDARSVPMDQVRHATLYFFQPGQVLRFPITVVHRPQIISLEKSCQPAQIHRLKGTNCTVTLKNNSFTPANILLVDTLPPQLALVRSSLRGAQVASRSQVRHQGLLPGISLPTVTIVDASGATPGGGFLPLSTFGITPFSGITDETILNLIVPSFEFAGRVYPIIGMASNGYAVVGGGSGADILHHNQQLPDPARPNNVLAPFWTDLDPGSGGAMRAAILTDGFDDWLVLEWDRVPTHSGDDPSNSFQIWIGLNGVEDITFVYADIGDGNGSWLTVGAENLNGSSGQNWYVDGAGNAVTNGTELRVVSLPGADSEIHQISYTAIGRFFGNWSSCADLSSSLFQGRITACASGQVLR